MLDAPLIFEPLAKVRVWGGRELRARFAAPPAEPIGESWEIADHAPDVTRVARGEWAGRTLRELFAEHCAELCGRAVDPASPGVFPLLLKLLDPAEDLSVQVHPDDAYAGQQKAGELGKTEAWYVLSAAPGGKIYHGFKPGVDRAQFAAALERGTVAEVLNAVPAAAGQIFHIPAGLVHALGAGVRIAEIQQNSDTTYRVFDWNRVGLDGKPRELHIEHALAVADFAPPPATATAAPLATPGCRHERRIDCEKFRFETLSHFAGRPVFLNTRGESFHLITVAEGGLQIRTPSDAVKLQRWDSALIPAAAGEYSLAAQPGTTALCFYRPLGEEKPS